MLEEVPSVTLILECPLPLSVILPPLVTHTKTSARREANYRVDTSPDSDKKYFV